MGAAALPQSGAELSHYYAARAREYERIYDKPERQPDLARLKHAIPRHFARADAGSSTPVSRVDADGNSYQLRRLDDGSEHEVLKNFPAEDEMRSALGGLALAIECTAYDHYWLLKYAVAA